MIQRPSEAYSKLKSSTNYENGASVPRCQYMPWKVPSDVQNASIDILWTILMFIIVKSDGFAELIKTFFNYRQYDKLSKISKPLVSIKNGCYLLVSFFCEVHDVTESGYLFFFENVIPSLLFEMSNYILGVVCKLVTILGILSPALMDLHGCSFFLCFSHTKIASARKNKYQILEKSLKELRQMNWWFRRCQAFSSKHIYGFSEPDFQLKSISSLLAVQQYLKSEQVTWINYKIFVSN